MQDKIEYLEDQLQNAKNSTQDNNAKQPNKIPIVVHLQEIRRGQLPPFRQVQSKTTSDINKRFQNLSLGFPPTRSGWRNRYGENDGEQEYELPPIHQKGTNQE